MNELPDSSGFDIIEVSNTKTEARRYDIDIVMTRTHEPSDKDHESNYTYSDDEYYSDGGTQYYEFEPIEFKHSYSNPTGIIRKYLLCIGACNLFSCGGFITGLYIDEIGYIGFPLGEYDAKRIISKSKMAPFGKKEETVFDKNIRYTWQMEPSQFIIKNPKWDSVISSLVDHVCNKLRFNSKMVKHILYKLLIYEPGSFFKPHRDTEKEHGMFATLVVILPSVYSGGQLVVRHCGREYEYDFSNIQNAFETNFAAFYADCEHEIKPVITGYRMCLIYNLVNVGTKITPDIKHNEAILRETIEAIKNWIINVHTCPTFLVYGLEHRYTNAGLSFEGLKGKDIVIAQVLKKVSESVPLDIALVNIKRCLIKDNGGTKERITILEYITEGEDQPLLKKLLIYHENMIQAQFWENKDEDGEDYIPTGNEGAVAARLYCHTGIIFSPRQIRHHKYFRENNKYLCTMVEYLNTLERNDHREAAASVLALCLKNSNSEKYGYSADDMFDMYSILYRYDCREPLMDFIEHVINLRFFSSHDSIDELSELVWKLHKEFPTISTAPSFRVLVGHIMKLLEDEDGDYVYRYQLEKKQKLMSEFRILLDMDFV